MLTSMNSIGRQPPAYDYFHEPTVYAQIDPYKTISSTGTIKSTHSTGGSGTSQQPAGGFITTTSSGSTPYQSPVPPTNQQSISPASSSLSATLPHPSKQFSSREIVTIRTPLMFTQQESCV